MIINLVDVSRCENLAVVIIEMLRFDDILDDYQAHYGGLSVWSLVVVVVSLALGKFLYLV